jgi:hypothetical protein
MSKTTNSNKFVLLHNLCLQFEHNINNKAFGWPNHNEQPIFGHLAAQIKILSPLI